MTDKQIRRFQIYALQVIFTLAYVLGVTLIVAFIMGSFLFADWAISYLVNEAFNLSSITIDPNVTSKALALCMTALPLVKNHVWQCDC